MMVCDHCGNDTSVPCEHATKDYVAWCNYCIEHDGDMILNARTQSGVRYGFCPLSASFWTAPKSMEMLRAIPKRINNPNQKCSQCFVPCPHANPNDGSEFVCVSCKFLSSITEE